MPLKAMHEIARNLPLDVFLNPLSFSKHRNKKKKENKNHKNHPSSHVFLAYFISKNLNNFYEII